MTLPGPSVRQQVIAITALGAALRFVGLNQSIWHDEHLTILLAQLPFREMMASIPRIEASPPVYYVLLWGWDHVFGTGVIASRLLGVLIGLALTPVMYGIAQRVTGSHRVGMVAAACAACSPLMVWYSQEVRPYGLLVLLSAIATLMFVRILSEGPDRRSLMIWAFVSALALGTHFYAVFTIIPQAVWLLIRYRRRSDVLLAVNVVGLGGLALLPMLTSETSGLGFLYITRVPRSTRLAQIIPQFLLGVTSPAHTVLKFACIGIVAAGILLLVLRGTTAERRAGVTMACLAIAGFALAMLVVVLVRDSLLTRNLIGLWVPAALVVAIGLGATRNRIAGTVLVLGLSGIGIAIVIAVASTPSLQRADWVGVARVLRAAPPTGHLTDGRRLVVLEDWLAPVPLQVYMPRLQASKPPVVGTTMTGVGEIDLVRVLQTAPSGTPSCWWGTPCVTHSTPPPHPSRIPGFRVVQEQRIQEFVLIRLRPVGRPRAVTERALAAAINGVRISSSTYLSEPSLTG